MSRKSLLWSIVYGIILLELLYLELVLIFLKPYWVYVNTTLGSLFGASLEYGYILITVVLIPLVYLGYLFYQIVIQAINNQETKIRIVNIVLPPVIFLVFGVFIQFIYGQFGTEIEIVYKSFLNYSILFYLTASLAITAVFAQFIVPRVPPVSAVGISGLLLMLLFLSTITFSFLVVPPNVISGDLPEKPLVIAHRGAGFYGPENTIEAMQYGFDRGILYQEIDVQVSYDGELFLLHDDTLKRTTNVEDIFPVRADDDANTFNFSELQSLDAGSKYVDDDPYQYIQHGKISSDIAESFRGSQIPSFKTALNFSRDHSIYLDIDYKEPDEDHPYYNGYYSLIHNAINDSGIDLDHVIIFADQISELQDVEAVMPECITTLNLDHDTPPSGDLLGIDGVALHFGVSDDKITSYLDAGLKVNIYTVISKSRFSQVWALGVDFVVSDIPMDLEDMNNPQWKIQQSIYFLSISILYILEIVVILYIYWKRKSQVVE